MTLDRKALMTTAFDATHRELEAKLFGSAASSTTFARPGPEGEFTLERLREAMPALPPRQTWVASQLFPPNGVMRFAGPDEEIVAINIDTWRRLVASAANCPVERIEGPGYVMGVAPFRLDADPTDSETQAAHRAAERRRIFTLLADTLAADYQATFARELERPAGDGLGRYGRRRPLAFLNEDMATLSGPPAQPAP